MNKGKKIPVQDGLYWESFPDTILWLIWMGYSACTASCFEEGRRLLWNILSIFLI